MNTEIRSFLEAAQQEQNAISQLSELLKTIGDKANELKPGTASTERILTIAQEFAQWEETLTKLNFHDRNAYFGTLKGLFVIPGLEKAVWEDAQAQAQARAQA